MKVNDRVKVHIYHCFDEVKTRNYDKVFTVYEKNGKLGIDWNTDKSPYTCDGEVFTPFETFASSVIFENVDTGEKFFYNDFSGRVCRVE